MSEVWTFRKRPVEIEAMQWTGDFSAALKFITVEFSVGDTGRVLFIPTLEGEIQALPGDWIIKGIKGEFYPCKPDIFRATYETDDGEWCKGCGGLVHYSDYPECVYDDDGAILCPTCVAADA